MRAKKHDEYPFYRLEARQSMKVPEALVDLARRRVGGLVSFDQSRRSLIDILANAYLIGMDDAVDVLNETVDRKDQP